MKTISHTLMGFLASVLYATGFSRIANRIDMSVLGISEPEMVAGMATVIPCVNPCDEAVSEHA